VALRKGVGLVLALILVAVLVSAAGMVAMLLIIGREPIIPGGSTLVLRLRGDLPRWSPGRVRPVPAAAATVRSVVEALHKARVDRRIRSLL